MWQKAEVRKETDMGNIKEQEIATNQFQKPARKGEMLWVPVQMLQKASKRIWGVLTKEALKWQ